MRDRCNMKSYIKKIVKTPAKNNSFNKKLLPIKKSDVGKYGNNGEIKFLIGEQLGMNIGNNGFSFWKNALRCGVDASFVVRKEVLNQSPLVELHEDYKSKLIIKDSIEHLEAYNKADMLFCTLSFQDILPTCYQLREIDKPLVYLQHGILGMKEIYYNSISYYGHMYRFMYYNSSLKNHLIENNFEPYQLKYLSAQPRYEELLNKAEKHDEVEKSILMFITWRESGDYIVPLQMLDDISEMADDYKLEVLLHDQLIVPDDIFDKYNFPINYIKDVDFQKKLASSEYFITDYSSTIWDAVALGKKVYNYILDYEDFSNNREMLITESELKNIKATSVESLKSLMNSDYNYDNYFYNNTNFDREKVLSGEVTRELVEYYINQIENKISFVGYNFFGIGGTVTATKALVYGYLKNDYLVEMMSINKTCLDQLTVPGATMKRLVDWNYREKSFNSNKYHLDITDFKLDYTENPNIYNQVTEKKLINYLKNGKFSKVYSVRELTHLYVNKFEANYDAIYIFHTDFEYFKENANALYNRIKGEKFNKGIFLTEYSRDMYISDRELEFDKTQIIPNALFKQPRIRYDSMPKFKVNLKNINIDSNEVFLHIELFTNHKYIMKNQVKGLTLKLDDKILKMNMKDTDEEYPASLEYVNETDVNIKDVLFLKSKIEALVDYKITTHKCEVQNSELKFNLGHPFSNITIVNEMINIDSKLCTLLKEDEFEYLFACDKNFAINTPYQNLENNDHYYRVVYNELTDMTYSYKNELYDINLSGKLVELPIFTNNANMVEVCAVLRVSEDRRSQVLEYIEFAKYIKEKSSSIKINVFGGGDILDEVRKLVTESNLEKYIEFKGMSSNVEADTQKYSTQISFSYHENFSMTYIEAITSGKRLFTYENAASLTMFKEEKFIFIDSYADLQDKILSDNYAQFDEVKKRFDIDFSVDNIINQIRGV